MKKGTVEIERCQIAYIEAGSNSNPPVLLLHGISKILRN